jgi:pimeloyl-ACP methyl ester carboxylesterase
MKDLGYAEYFVQGADWGSQVTISLAQHYPDAVKGIHLNVSIALSDETIQLEVHRRGTVHPRHASVDPRIT